ncbi:hypothetical protein BH10ACT11_BH10ACT11_10780 [soil metagenome]
MAKRKRREKEPEVVEAYTDDEGNVLRLRTTLSEGTIRKILRSARQGSTADDIWQRRIEMLFERLAVSWEISGLPMDDQAMLIGRYRMAAQEERRWVQHTIARHVDQFLPELAP